MEPNTADRKVVVPGGLDRVSVADVEKLAWGDASGRVSR